MLTLLSQIMNQNPWWHPAGWGIMGYITATILIAGAIGILVVVLRVLEIVPPPWFIKICWIVAVCIVGLLAIRIIASFA